jgi:RNA polymerase sigma-70 factor (ECF subfamily)
VPSNGNGDSALLAAARGGDAGAIAALLARYQKRVLAFGLGMCGDRADAEDVLQETLLTAARSLKSFRGEAAFSTWLYTIARSYCGKARRRSKFAPKQAVPLDTVEADAPGPDELVQRNERSAALAAALQALPPTLREVLLLRDVEGLRAVEVARVTGVSVAAVKSRLHRARAALRAELEGAAPARPGCPDVLAAFSRNLEGDLDPKRCAEMQRHLDGCPGCRATCASLKRNVAACAALAQGPVPPEVRRAIRASLRDALGRLRPAGGAGA